MLSANDLAALCMLAPLSRNLPIAIPMAAKIASRSTGQKPIDNMSTAATIPTKPYPNACPC